MSEAIAEKFIVDGQIATMLRWLDASPPVKLDSKLAAFLLRHARLWHSNGYCREQGELCALIRDRSPFNVDALHLSGFHAQFTGDFAAAEQFYARALALDENAAFSKLALAQLRMRRSHFHEGREWYESRFDAVGGTTGADWRGLPQVRWNGGSLDGKSLYIWAEQGLGDVVMFASFLRFLLSQPHKRIALGCPSALTSVFARSFPGLCIEPLDDAALHALGPTAATVYPRLASMPAAHLPLEPLKRAHDYVTLHGQFDYAAPLGDLLVYCAPDIRPSSRAGAYLSADAGQVAVIGAWLEAIKTGKRIGISWHTSNVNETQRNVAPEAWAPLLSQPDRHFISLQHQPDRDEIRRLRAIGCQLTVPEELGWDMDAEALFALVASMDEVVTIDNSTVHIAGALGRPTQLLLPLGHNFRWPELPGDSTFWYDSVKTLRQTRLFAWDEVMAKAADGLQQKLA